MSVDWQNCFGGSLVEYTRDITSVNDNYLIIGMTQSNDGDITAHHGGADMWLIKTDNQGNLLWDICYGGSHGDGGVRIFPANANEYFLLGSAHSSDGDISDDPYPESTDYWIVKIDSAGTILWDRIVGGNILDQLWTGTPTSDGGIVAFGWSGSTDGDVSTNYGLYDMWLVKLNNDGDVLWDRSFGTSGFDWGQAIIETSDKGFLIGGASKIKDGGNLTCEPHSDETEAILVKLDSLGNIEWQQCYGGSRDESFTRLLELDDGYIITGYTASNDGDVSGWHPGANGDPHIDIWVVKVDFDGNLLWQKCLGGSYSESLGNIFQTDNGDFVIIGVTQSNDGDVSGNHSATNVNHDIWMVRLSNEGDISWQQCIGGLGDEIVWHGVIKKNDNRYVIAGQTDYGPSYDVGCDPHGDMWADFWVFEVYDTTVSITEVPQEISLQVYPNPAICKVTFSYTLPGNEPGLIEIRNLSGQVVAKLPLSKEEGEMVFDTRYLPAGIYFYTLKSNGTSATRKLVVTK